MSSQSSGKRRIKPFEPSPTQEEFIQCNDKQVLLSGSFGSGKSRIGCEKGYLLNMKYPGNRGLIVRNTFTDVRSSTIEQTLLDEVIPESHIANHHETKHKITHFTGTQDAEGGPVLSEIQYHGLDPSSSTQTADDLPTKIGGQQYGWIFVDEGIEIAKGAWIQLMGRLRYTGHVQAGQEYKVPFRQIFTATNPASKTHWMYDWFFREEKGRWFKMTAHELAEHVDAIPQDYVDDMAENFSGMYYDRYVEGEWVASHGMVYNEYDAKTHLREAEDLPGNWTVEKRVDHGTYTSVFATPPDDWLVYRSIDFGYRNPFVCHWWAYDPDDDRHVMFREIYQTEELIEDLAQDIKRHSEGMQIQDSHADPAQAEDRATLQRHGVNTTEAKKDISAGVQEVKAALQPDNEGVPGLLFMRGARVHQADESLKDEGTATSTVDEITEYKWQEGKDEPEKELDHGMDTMRYHVYTVTQQTTMTREELERLEATFNEGF